MPLASSSCSQLQNINHRQSPGFTIFPFQHQNTLTQCHFISWEPQLEPTLKSWHNSNKSLELCHHFLGINES